MVGIYGKSVIFSGFGGIASPETTSPSSSKPNTGAPPVIYSGAALIAVAKVCFNASLSPSPNSAT